MRDPFAWSIPSGRLFGITIRVHLLFPVVALGLILRFAFIPPTGGGQYPPYTWLDVSVVLLLLFLSVLLHEFGHCFGARAVGGEAQEILLWPLGGLAQVEVPNTPRANLLTTLAGPGVNLVLCLASAAALACFSPAIAPPLNPFDVGAITRTSFNNVGLTAWDGSTVYHDALYSFATFFARLFWVNWVLFLLNVVLIGFPMDGGRIFQCILWPYFGYRRATLAAIMAGFVTMFIVFVAALVFNELLPFCLAVFIYISCKQQWILLETGGEESLFGYDFSQGYTSLERTEPPTATPTRKKLSWWQRWRQNRAARKLQREEEQRVAEERRMDELLEKVQREGIASLSDDEKRFMKRVSDRIRNDRNV